MIVVSDTSCITNLMWLGKVSILHDLFGEVIIPAGVARELVAGHSELPAFLEIRTVTNQDSITKLTTEILDPGEAEAIVLAEEIHADALLIDEAAGRSVALQCRLRIIGLLGILVRPKEARLIPFVRPLLDQLQNEIGFYISAVLRQRTLEAVGEI